MLDRDIYQLFESASPWLIGWISLFVAWTGQRIVRRLLGHDVPDKIHFLLEEAPGLPLTLLHTVAFAMAIWKGDVASVLLFMWWGPGFLIVATIYIRSLKSGRRVNWQPIGKATSVGCKLNYLAFMVIYFALDMPGTMYTFSLWIMHDQMRLAWFSNSGDRTRRTFEDLWLVRILYPGLLLLPLFRTDAPLRVLSAAIGLLVLVGWLSGLVRVKSGGGFFVKPGADSENLRDIVYLERTKSPADP